MNLQQLTYFVAIARLRSFTQAAQACSVAQPALSQQIRKLEDELGLAVFERTKRGVGITAAGAEFLAYAEKILNLLSEGKQRLSDMRELRRGVVTVLCTPTVATYWLPQVLFDYRQRHPNVEIKVQEQAGCTSQDVGDAVADLGVVEASNDGPRRADGAVHEETLFVDEQVLVVPASHRLAKMRRVGQTIALETLGDESFVLPKPPCGLSRVAARAFAAAGIQPRVVLETSQIEAVSEMVAAGLGIGLMPRMAMHRDDPKLTWCRIASPAPSRTIAVAWRAERALSPSALALVAVLRDVGARTKLSTAPQLETILVNERRPRPASKLGVNGSRGRAVAPIAAR